MERISQIRKQSEKEFLSLPLPKGKDENYRFFPFDNLKILDETPAGILEGSTQNIGLQSDELACIEVSSKGLKKNGNFANGKFSALADALKQEPELLGSALEIPQKFQQDKFAQLASARWSQGIFASWNPGTNVEGAIRLHQHSDQTWCVTRNLLQLEAGSEGVFLFELTSATQPTETIDLTTIQMAEHSQLHLVLLVAAGAECKFVQRIHASLGKNSKLKVTPIFLGAAAVQCRLTVDLAAPGAELELKAAARSRKQEVYDFWFEADHTASHTKSTAEFLAVLDDKSRTIFNGMIHVHKQALHCEAVQKSKSLLLSEKAQALAHPKLIIQTDEVKCAHGASVSTVNPDQVYYLESRGITKAEATRMIVEGFTEPVIAQVPVESFYQRIEQYLGQKTAEVEQ